MIETLIRFGSLADIGGLHNQRLLCAQSARFPTRFLCPLSAISGHWSRYRIKLLLKKNLKCEPWSHSSLYDVLLWRHASICWSNTRLEFWSPPWASSDRTWVGQHREAARTITEGAAA